jgi:glucose/arabinose dehydrogenase
MLFAPAPQVGRNAFALLTFALAGGATLLGAGDPDHGKVLFQQTCALCHATSAAAPPTAGQGPLLAGVVGRPAGSLSVFGYTKALTDSRLVWNEDSLDRFLANPQALVPGTAMGIVVASASDRRDLIAYLKTLPAATAAELSRLSSQQGSAGSPAADPGDWRNDGPTVRHRIDLAALPPPYATRSAGNAPRRADRPAGAALHVPPGFEVRLFTSEVAAPRLLHVAPNGDVFVAETGRGRIRVLRAADGEAHPSKNSLFAKGLDGPFGIAFYPAGPHPRWVYVGELNRVVRFPYEDGDLVARGGPQTIVPQLAPHPGGGHTTRDVVFSADGARLYISVGSASNVGQGVSRKPPGGLEAWEQGHALGSDWGFETNRANVLVTDPEGRTPLRFYATGIRNPVGLAIDPADGQLWCSTNERDALGDNLVPDYISRVKEGGFYGWPWYYMGDHEDPRHAGERPDLKGKVSIPDVPVQSHSASLQLCFYSADSGPAVFPADYRGSIFAAFHGSWNRTNRTGSKVIRVLFRNGQPTGEYEDFVTGWVVDNAHVWGRPVGVAVAHDGALLVSDDVSSSIWRVAHVGAR